MRYRISRVDLLPVIRLGAFIGALMSVVPTLLLASVALYGLHALRLVLEGWREVRLPLGPLPSTTVNMVALLHLEQWLLLLRQWDGAWPALILITAACGVALGALAGGVVAGATVLLLNVTARVSGGLVLRMDADGSDS